MLHTSHLTQTMTALGEIILKNNLNNKTLSLVVWLSISAVEDD